MEFNSEANLTPEPGKVINEQLVSVIDQVMMRAQAVGGQNAEREHRHVHEGRGRKREP
jgi:hypothetical protein